MKKGGRGGGSCLPKPIKSPEAENEMLEWLSVDVIFSKVKMTSGCNLRR